ncbi:MAG: nucleoside hydrolase [Herbinix sp.]|jgi:inosine-uridine nucleoside N-ribohydrolase|nr:nucleoside hydrolase [Herbinix sp.]
MNQEEILRKLQKPKGRIDVVIDTDTFNEIDDQFALSYLIKSEDKLNLKAIYAAPFFNEKSTDPEDGMEKSYDEIMHLLELMDREEYKSITFKGSRAYLPNEQQAVDSPAARNLIELAMARKDEEPLYVIAIGAITNVASAILLEPKIVDKIVLIWLGGHAHDWPRNNEFNLIQDIAAARIVFGCGVPLVQLPCLGVVSSFTTTEHELKYWLKDRNKLCDYLLAATIKEAESMEESTCWSRVIWDVTAVAWLLEDEGKFMNDRLVHSPIPEYDDYYAFSKSRHLIKYVYEIRRDFLFEHLFKTLMK